MIGQRFGRWTVTATRAGSRLLCLCDCGDTKEVLKQDLVRGKSKSCGCLRKELTSKRCTTHGGSLRTAGKLARIYTVWTGMKQRCLDKKAKTSARYRAKGIIFHESWRSFAKFKSWALANGYADDLYLDRKDNDGPYSPNNCHFTTNLMNCHNRGLLNGLNTSGYAGVSKLAKGGYKMRVRSTLGPKVARMGFCTAEGAALARDIHCVKHGIPLPLNFPELALQGPL